MVFFAVFFFFFFFYSLLTTCKKSNTMIGVTSGEGTVYPSGASEFIPRITVAFMLLNLYFSLYYVFRSNLVIFLAVAILPAPAK